MANTVRIQVAVDPATLARLHEAAQRLDHRPSALIERALVWFLDYLEACETHLARLAQHDGDVPPSPERR